jgi:TrmH family RNA methyltransferase
MITSPQNPKIKQVRLLNSQAKTRQKQGLFVIEGIRLIEEAGLLPQRPKLVLYTPDLPQRGLDLVSKFQAEEIQVELVSRAVFKDASDTESPQGLLAVYPQQQLELPSKLNLLVILDSIRDPGNLGTIIRTALAAGADGVILSPGTVDPFSPKVLRAGMGSHFQIPILELSWEEIGHLVGNMKTLLADIDQGQVLWEIDLTNPLAIILGGEADGPGKEARELADQHIMIPMSAKTESLNAAVAGAVLLFEVKRQRTKFS